MRSTLLALSMFLSAGLPAQRGSATAFGYGCGGVHDGLPSIRVIQVPVIGGHLGIEISGLIPNRIGLLVWGDSNQTWGDLSLPVSLDELGMEGCQLYVSGEALPAAYLTGSGTRTLRFPIPPDPAFVGRTSFQQFLFEDPDANEFGVGTTNAVELTVGLPEHMPGIENDGWLSVHGRPFFPIGVWSQKPTATSVLFMKGLGINTFLNNGLRNPELTNPELMDLLEAADMWGILQHDPNVADHPRILGWLLPDEPDLNNKPPAEVRAKYDSIKAAHPEHFVGLNLSSGFYWDANFGSSSREPKYRGYTEIPDIVSFDMYPVTGWNKPEWLYMPGAMTEFLLENYVDRKKPVWGIVEASQKRLTVTPPNTPGPTPEQMRFQVWDAIIHGATAIHYFVSAFNPFEFINLTPEIQQEMTQTNGQITDLSSIILSAPPALDVTSREASNRAHNFTIRQTGSTYYLFVDNADMDFNPASIAFQFDREISSVVVYGEEREITPSGNTFSDAFAPLEVHIYQVRF